MSLSFQGLTNEQIERYAPSAFQTVPHASRSNRYAFIPTSNVIDGMREAGFIPVMASQSVARTADRKDYTKHTVRFRAPQSLQRPAVGDSLIEAVLINSHDGSSAYKLMAGIFRLVCSNGMVVADSLFGMIHIRHTGNVIGDVVEGSNRIFAESGKVIDVIGKWSDIALKPAEQLAFAESAHQLRFADAEGKTNTSVTPQMLLSARRPDDQGNDLWHTFNRVQENSIRGFSARAVRRQSNDWQARGARAVRSIDGDVKLNRALWSLGEKMAEIKATA